ncbi:cruciform cutting endonuclease [Lachancea thermotolerans CBS 6340]|uniref:KLTH0C00990p n=1 Tax=Lachancea thermotolerans (strain ATCC 56472 / CBS 6340 / NRRL Y-8284) TaxID=559295 RepID=C5DDH3_LACTC|nr:KLTH0C00990p [Lachancea thermotolerans CBS 6340]CAR21834.1 KLTH0C00990p [Lachancea thermotolerans CBS 6340]
MHKAGVGRSTLEALDWCCHKSDAKTLKKLAFSVGSRVGTTKAIITENILDQCGILNQLAAMRTQRGNLSITAVDLGLENFAYSRFSWAASDNIPRLVKWDKIRLDGAFIDLKMQKLQLAPKHMALLGQKLTEVLMLDPTDVFVIERQRTRTLGSANVPDPILKVNALEYTLFAFLRSKALYSRPAESPGQRLDYIVESSDPKKMTEYWCNSIPTNALLDSTFGAGSPKAKLKARSSALTKMLKIALTKSMLMERTNPKFEVPEIINKNLGSLPLAKKFSLFDLLGLGEAAGKSKEDDLADSLLHGLAWLQWTKTFEELKNTIEPSRSSTQALEIFKGFVETKSQELSNYSMSCISRL